MIPSCSSDVIAHLQRSVLWPFRLLVTFRAGNTRSLEGLGILLLQMRFFGDNNGSPRENIQKRATCKLTMA